MVTLQMYNGLSTLQMELAQLRGQVPLHLPDQAENRIPQRQDQAAEEVQRHQVQPVERGAGARFARPEQPHRRRQLQEALGDFERALRQQFAGQCGFRHARQTSSSQEAQERERNSGGRSQEGPQAAAKKAEAGGAELRGGQSLQCHRGLFEAQASQEPEVRRHEVEELLRPVHDKSPASEADHTRVYVLVDARNDVIGGAFLRRPDKNLKLPRWSILLRKPNSNHVMDRFQIPFSVSIRRLKYYLFFYPI